MTPLEGATKLVEEIIKATGEWEENTMTPKEKTDSLFQQIEENLSDSLETMQLALLYNGVSGKGQIVCKETGKVLKNVQGYELRTGDQKGCDPLTIRIVVPRFKNHSSSQVDPSPVT